MLFSVQTPAAGGTAFAQFAAAWCYDGNGYILNDTGTSIDVRIGASGSIQTLAAGGTLPIKLVYSMAELYVRRTDQSTTQVTVEAQVGTGSAGGGGSTADMGVIAAAAVAGHDASPAAHVLGRPRLGVFGNSIADQSSCFLQFLTTTMASAAAQGQAVLAVADASGIAGGAKIAVRLYDSRLHAAVVASVDGNNVTLTTALPALVRTAEPVLVYTTKQPSGWTHGIGLASAANSLCGGAFDLVPAYGYGGAAAAAMLQDLPAYLRQYRPSHCVLHLFENDLVGNTSLDELKRVARSAARMCIAAGCTPIVCSCLPQSTITGSRVAVFDLILSYVTTDIPALVHGAVGVDCSTKWLDTSNPTYPRSPTAGWTDGVHPLLGKLWSAAALTVAPALAALATASELPALTPYSITQADGTGGTLSDFAGGSIAPDGWILSKYNGRGVASTSRNSDGSLRLSIDWTGVSAATWDDNVYAGYSYTHPVAWTSGRYFRAYLRAKPVTWANMSMLRISVNDSEGFKFAYGPGISSELDMPTGSTVVLFSAPFQISAGNTALALSLLLMPKNGSTAAVGVLDLYELGLIECAAPSA